MRKKRKILISNDDGIFADGLLRLAEAAKEYGEVWIVAPDSQRSAASHAISLHHGVEGWKVDYPVEEIMAYACTGTPADCIRIGVRNIVPGRPDLVLCGINHGYNAGTDLQYSATVGAAMEAAFQKLPVIAFSEEAVECHEVTDHYLKEILEKLMDLPLSSNEIWNVNFPGCPLKECRGVLYERTVSEDVFFDDSYTETLLENGRVLYRVEGIRRWDALEGTDLRAVLDGYVSVGKAKNIS